MVIIFYFDVTCYYIVNLKFVWMKKADTGAEKMHLRKDYAHK